MPLAPGKANIGKNIKTEESRGKPYDQALAIALSKALDKNAEEPPSGKRMKRVEAFSIGQKRGKVYTPSDLREMVDNFNRYGKGQRPGFDVPTVFGHEETPEEQQRFLEDTSIPAAAWVDGAYEDGEKLYLDLRDVSPELEQALKDGSYGAVSVEIYDDPPEGVPGKGKMLRRLAFLGGEIPQDKNLKRPTYDQLMNGPPDEGPWPTTTKPRDFIPNSDRSCFTCFSEVRRMEKVIKHAEPEIETPNKDEMVKKLAEAGIDSADLASPDAMMAAMCRMADSMTGLQGQMADMEPKESVEGQLPEPATEEQKREYADKARRYAAYAARYKKYAEPETPAATSPLVAEGNVPEMAKMSEQSIQSIVAAAARAAADQVRAEFAPIRKEVETFSEENKRDTVRSFIRNWTASGHIDPSEMDAGPGLPTLEDELMALDNKTPVHRFSENGKTVTLTPFQARMERIKRRKPRRVGELVGTSKMSETHDAGKEKIANHYETYSEQFQKSGITLEKFIAGYEVGMKNGNIKSADEYLNGAA